MRYIIIFVFLGSLGSILCGYFLEVDYNQKLIGFGIIGLFFIVFPLFAYYRWKDKNIEDYMLTKENLDKMRENQKKSRR